MPATVRRGKPIAGMARSYKQVADLCMGVGVGRSTHC